MDLKDSTSEGSMGSLQPSSIQIFANTTTLHGLRHVFVYGPVTVRRLLWTLAFVGSLGLLLVESSDRVAFYFSYQHVTKVDEVVANSLVFPAVTICNLNEFRFSRLTTNDLYHAGELLALLDVNLQIPNPHLADPAVLAILQEKANFKHYKPKVFSMQEFLARVGHDLKDMMLYCKFKGQECNHEDFKTLPLDGSNMNHQTPQLSGVAMQGGGGGGGALNPILGTTPSLDQPSQRGMSLPVGISTTGLAQEVPPAQSVPVRRGQWFRSGCSRRRAPPALNPSWPCEESVHSPCFEERTLDPVLDCRQHLDAIFPPLPEPVFPLWVKKYLRVPNVKIEASPTSWQKSHPLHDTLEISASKLLRRASSPSFLLAHVALELQSPATLLSAPPESLLSTAVVASPLAVASG